MSHVDRFPAPHPLCTCPDDGPSFATLDRPEPDRSQCRGGMVAHPPPLDGDELRELLRTFMREVSA